MDTSRGSKTPCFCSCDVFLSAFITYNPKTAKWSPVRAVKVASHQWHRFSLAPRSQPTPTVIACAISQICQLGQAPMCGAGTKLQRSWWFTQGHVTDQQKPSYNQMHHPLTTASLHAVGNSLVWISKRSPTAESYRRTELHNVHLSQFWGCRFYWTLLEDIVKTSQRHFSFSIKA